MRTVTVDIDHLRDVIIAAKQCAEDVIRTEDWASECRRDSLDLQRAIEALAWRGSAYIRALDRLTLDHPELRP